jgi:hypothetical protein
MAALTSSEALELIRPKLKTEQEEFDTLYATNIKFRDFVDSRIDEYIEDPLVIIASDVSQAEVRVMAELSNEEKLIDIYNNQYKNLLDGKDIDEMKEVDFHYVTASNIYKKSVYEVSKSERKNAKTITFALLYGSSEMGIAERTDLTVKEAKELLNNFWASYTKIRAWVGNTLDFATKHGYIKTPIGRKKFTPTLLNRPEFARNFWKNRYLGQDVPYPRYIKQLATSEARQCQNFPIQSFTSDIVILGTSIIEKQLQLKGIEHYLHTIIHDSIVMSVRLSQVHRISKLIHHVFEERIPKILNLHMPMLMEVEVGFDCFSTIKLPFKYDSVSQEEMKNKMLESFKKSVGKVSFKTIDTDGIKDLLTTPPKNINISSQILKKYGHDKSEFNQTYKDYVENKQLKIDETDINNIFNLMKLV